jgi:hypothetical protein
MLASLLAAPAAQAAVISVDFSANPLSAVPFNFNGLYLNVVTGAASASTNNVQGYDINPYFAGSTGPMPQLFLFVPSTGGVVGVASTSTADVLTVGMTIGPASGFTAPGAAGATLAATGIGYFGFRFINEGTGLINYGFLTLSETLPLAAGAVRVLAYAYENTGAAITVTAVPEPSSYAMFTLGVAGVGALARRRRVNR